MAGNVVIDGSPELRAFLRHFVCVAADGRRFEISDGEPWLANLSRSLSRSSYIWAQDAAAGSSLPGS